MNTATLWFVQEIDSMQLKEVISNSSSLIIRGRWTLRAFLCGLLTLSLVAGDALAGQSLAASNAERDRAAWEKVRAITPDQQIVVETRSSGGSSDAIRTYQGNLRKWEPDRLVLGIQKGGDREIGKSLIRYVWVKEKGNRGRAAAIGGAVGFGAGMAIGVASFGSLDKHGGTGQKIGLGTVFGLIFGGVGALIGRAAGGTRMMTVYQAR